MLISRSDAKSIVDFAKTNLNDKNKIKNLSWNERKLLYRALRIINYSRDAGEKIKSDKNVSKIFNRIKGKKDSDEKPQKNRVIRFIKRIANRYLGRIRSKALLSELKKVKVEPKYGARTCVFRDRKIGGVQDGVDEEIGEGEIQVKIFLGDLLEQENVDAIVNPANIGLNGGGGVDGLIGSKAGRSIYRECQKQLKVKFQEQLKKMSKEKLKKKFKKQLKKMSEEEIKKITVKELTKKILKQLKEEKKKSKGETGEAYLTGSGKLEEKKGIKHVIHAIGPKKGTENRKQLLRDAYYNSLMRAHESKLTSIAFPAISIGIFGYPAEEAAEVALNAVKEFIESNPSTKLKEIRLVYFDDGSYRSNNDVTSFNACHAHLDKLISSEVSE